MTRSFRDTLLRRGAAALVLTLAAGAAGAAEAQPRLTEEGYQLCDPVGACRQYPFSSEVAYIRRGVTTEFLIVKGLIDHLDPQRDISATGGAGVQYVSKGHYPGVGPMGSGYVKVRVSVPSGAVLGTMSLRFGGTRVPLRVVREGRITQVTQMPAQGSWGEDVQVTVAGEDIGNARISLDQHAVLRVVSRSDSRLVFVARGTGSPRSSAFMILDDQDYQGSVHARLQFLAAPGVQTVVRYGAGTTTTASAPPPRAIGVVAVQPAPSSVPDLIPVPGGMPLRHIAARRKIAGDFCQGMVSQPATAVTRLITVPDLRWGVTNTGRGDVTTPFVVELLAGTAIVQRETVPALRAGETRYFAFRRPQSQTEVARMAMAPDRGSRDLYNATGGECVQVAEQAAHRDWQDAAFRIRVDPAGAVTAEANRTNNDRTF